MKQREHDCSELYMEPFFMHANAKEVPDRANLDVQIHISGFACYEQYNFAVQALLYEFGEFISAYYFTNNFWDNEWALDLQFSDSEKLVEMKNRLHGIQDKKGKGQAHCVQRKERQTLAWTAH